MRKKSNNSKCAPAVAVQRIVSVPRGYKRVAAQIDAISREFKDGASMKRLSRKHSLPLLTVEGVIRMKMLGHANKKVSDAPDSAAPNRK